MINISNRRKKSIMIFNLGTPSASSLRGNSLSSQASQRSSPYLNAHPVNSKEPATIANVTIANLNIAHQKRSSLESPSAVNRAIAQITGGGGSHHNSNQGSYSSPVNGIHSSGSSPSPVAMMLRNSHPVSSGGTQASLSNIDPFRGATISGSVGTTSNPCSTASVASFSLSQASTTLSQGTYLIFIEYKMELYNKPSVLYAKTKPTFIFSK